MEWNNNIPEWKNEGTEPSESRKQTGFEEGYKPPAGIFNWFWSLVLKAIAEIQEKFGLHAENKSNPHGVTVSQIGAATEKHSAQHSKNGIDPIAPYNIGAVDAMIGTINGTAHTFDTALKQGEYNVQAVDAAGAPYDGSLYGKLIVTLSDGKEKTDSNWIWQEFLPASANKQRCWRMKINTGDWTDWYVLYDTGHKPSLNEIGAAADNHKHPYAINIGYDRTDINTGTDLNDILNIGCYRCSTATKAATLLNSPTKNAFIMDMIASTGGNITINPNSYSYATQRIYVMGGREYVRQIISNGDGTITFGEWITMYSTLDKPTPTDIGAAAASEHNLKTYTNLSQLGLSDGATLSQVARKLPNGSAIKIYVITTSNANLAPNATNGWFEAYRPSVNHVVFQYTTTSLKRYIADALNVDTETESITNWSKLATQGELEAHNQSASSITAGELGGRVMANADASANLANSQVRNINAGTSDLEAGKSSLGKGCIYVVYE